MKQQEPYGNLNQKNYMHLSSKPGEQLYLD